MKLHQHDLDPWGGTKINWLTMADVIIAAMLVAVVVIGSLVILFNAGYEALR